MPDSKISQLVSATALTGGVLSGVQGGVNKQFPATLFASAAQGALADSALQSSAIGVSIQAHSSVLDNTQQAFTTALKNKLDGVETGADVTDAVNVTAAGALMEGDVDLDIKTFVLPANTTISAFGKTLIDDVDAEAALATLGLPGGAAAFLRRNDAGDGIVGRTYAQVRGDLDVGILAGHRNKIINGGFEISQHGTSFVLNPTESVYTLDRFFIWNDTDQACTVSQQEHVLGQTDVPGNPANFLRINFATAPTTGLIYIFHCIEGVNTLAGRTFTFRSYIRPVAATQFRPFQSQKFGTGGSANVYQQQDLVSMAAGVWSKLEPVAATLLPSIAGKTIGNGDHLEAGLHFLPRTAGDYDISRISFVEGDVREEYDPFAPRHIGHELALCQRYYYTFAPVANYFLAMDGNSGWRALQIQHPVQMRAAPTVTMAANTNGTFAATYPSVEFVNEFVARLRGDVTDTNGIFTNLQSYEADAELYP